MGRRWKLRHLLLPTPTQPPTDTHTTLVTMDSTLTVTGIPMSSPSPLRPKPRLLRLRGRSVTPMLKLILLSLQATPPILILPSPMLSHTQPPTVCTPDIPMPTHQL